MFSPEDETFDVISRPTDDCNLYGVELNLDRDRAQCNNHQLFVIVSPIMSPQLLLIVANFQPNYFLDKLGPTSQVINPKNGSAPILLVTANYQLHYCQCSIYSQEFVELMIKREAEKETQEDLKQVFRVFDKVLQTRLNVALFLF